MNYTINGVYPHVNNQYTFTFWINSKTDIIDIFNFRDKTTFSPEKFVPNVAPIESKFDNKKPGWMYTFSRDLVQSTRPSKSTARIRYPICFIDIDFDNNNRLGTYFRKITIA